MAHYLALKHTIRGRKGTLVSVHGNDVKALQRLGVIGDKPYQGKAQADAPTPEVLIAQLQQKADKLTAQIDALKDKKKSAAKQESELATVQTELAELLAAQG